ncbi:MAG: nucleotidyltransferase family protein [Dehalococcoidales bacterium]|nr:nucleotidyltransferase family protein [Dehalococcoidales bacterium]
MDMNFSIEKAMILAAGKGTRLRPLTSAVPKCLLPVGNTPIVKHYLRWLKSYGIRKVAVNLHHKGDEIKAALGDGSSYDIDIHYSPEEVLLGTAGGVKRMEDFFTQAFYVVYGDTISDVDLSSLAEFHRQKQALMTIVLFEAANTRDTGIVEIDEDGKVTGFTEKPLKGEEHSNLSNGGIYILEPDIFNYITDEGFSDFGFDVIPRLIGEKVPVYGYLLGQDEYLIDIGTIEKYRQANIDIDAGRVKIFHEE